MGLSHLLFCVLLFHCPTKAPVKADDTVWVFAAQAEQTLASYEDGSVAEALEAKQIAKIEAELSELESTPTDPQNDALMQQIVDDLHGLHAEDSALKERSFI